MFLGSYPEDQSEPLWGRADIPPRSKVEYRKNSPDVDSIGLQQSIGVLWDDWEIHRERCDKSHEEFIKHLLGLHKHHCILKATQ